MDLIIEVNDFKWGVAYAGALASSVSKINGQVNKQHNVNIGIRSSNPALAPVVEAFPAPKTGTVIHPPSEEQWPHFDKLMAAYRAEELKMVHGIATNLDEMTYPLQLQDLASVHLQTLGVACNGGFWYPKIPASKLKDVEYCHALVEKADLIPIAQEFLKGMNITDPKIVAVDEDSLDMREVIQIVNLPELKVIVLEPGSDITWLCKAYYGSYDDLKNLPAICMVYNTPPNPRTMLMWAQVLPLHSSMDVSPAADLGRSWMIRKQFDFDFFKFVKERAKNAVT